jgi:hypothetical protein
MGCESTCYFRTSRRTEPSHTAPSCCSIVPPPGVGGAGSPVSHERKASWRQSSSALPAARPRSTSPVIRKPPAVEARQRCRDLVTALLVEDPARLALAARTFLATPGVIPGDYPADQTADAMMEADPKRFEAPVAAAAESAAGPLARFRLTRAVFRRFPGRYRERMLEVGRDVLGTAEVDAEVASWLLRKFGAEVVPELVAFMRRPGAKDQQLLVLREAVRILGPGADPVVQASLGSGCEELEKAAREALNRLGGRAPEA